MPGGETSFAAWTVRQVSVVSLGPARRRGMALTDSGLVSR